MASFKLNISDPKSGKSYQKEVKDEQASVFLGKNIQETVSGDLIDMPGYEFLITGGSDYCGFPMRRGILGVRKKINLLGGVGFRGGAKGMRRRKTVCGHKINDKIVQINLKVSKQGSKSLDVLFGKEEKPKEEKKEEPKSEEKPKEKKAEDKAAEKKEDKPVEEKKQESDEKKEEKPAEEPKKG